MESCLAWKGKPLVWHVIDRIDSPLAIALLYYADTDDIFLVERKVIWYPEHSVFDDNLLATPNLSTISRKYNMSAHGTSRWGEAVRNAYE
jgi:hypothetical protein